MWHIWYLPLSVSVAITSDQVTTDTWATKLLSPDRQGQALVSWPLIHADSGNTGVEYPVMLRTFDIKYHLVINQPHRSMQPWRCWQNSWARRDCQCSRKVLLPHLVQLTNLTKDRSRLYYWKEPAAASQPPTHPPNHPPTQPPSRSPILVFQEGMVVGVWNFVCAFRYV